MQILDPRSSIQIGVSVFRCLESWIWCQAGGWAWRCVEVVCCDFDLDTRKELKVFSIDGKKETLSLVLDHSELVFGM